MPTSGPVAQQGLDNAIDAAAFLAGVVVTDAQRPAVAAHLALGLEIAERIGPVPREAAPVFRP